MPHSIAHSQDEIVSFLSDAASYPGNAGNVKRVETHAAIVFLAGDRAYKLKRAVILPYLDFSTPEKRHAVLLRELEINAQFSPDLYIRVLPVTAGAGGALSIDGAGDPVDWLLEMRRFDQTALLDAVAQSRGLEAALLEKLARVVAHSHATAKPASADLGSERLRPVVDSLEKTFHQMEAALAPFSYRQYIGDLRRELDKQSDLLKQREGRGFVRRCHGDLHLKNIVLWNGMPALFDALEFDDGLATVDVLYDLAFLLMDLWCRDLRSEANFVFNRYFQNASLEDLKGLRLLPLFLSLRAAIRTMTGLHQLAVTNDDAAALRDEVQSYAALADACLHKTPPALIAIGGLLGTGKTSVARPLASHVGPAPGALHLRTDVERKSMLGVTPDHRLSEDAYAPGLRTEVYGRVLAKAETALKAVHSVIVDAVFPDAGSRAAVRDASHRTACAFHGLWLTAPEDVLSHRIAGRVGDASDADASVLSRQLETIAPPMDWAQIDASGSLSETVQNGLKAIDPSGRK